MENVIDNIMEKIMNLDYDECGCMITNEIVHEVRKIIKEELKNHSNNKTINLKHDNWYGRFDTFIIGFTGYPFDAIRVFRYPNGTVEILGWNNGEEYCTEDKIPIELLIKVKEYLKTI